MLVWQKVAVVAFGFAVALFSRALGSSEPASLFAASVGMVLLASDFIRWNSGDFK